MTADSDLDKDPSDTHWAHTTYGRIEAMIIDAARMNEIFDDSDAGDDADVLQRKVEELQVQLATLQLRERSSDGEIAELRQACVDLKGEVTGATTSRTS